MSDTERHYVDQLTVRLDGLSPIEQSDIIAEIKSHFAEARAEGMSDQEVADHLGSPVRLAQAYRLELTGEPRHGGKSDLPPIKWLGLAAILVATSLPTMIIVLVLATISFAFVVAGVAIIGGGLSLLAGVDPNWVKWPYPTSLAFVAGPALAATGVGVGYGLYKYVSFGVRALRRLLPRRASPPE